MSYWEGPARWINTVLLIIIVFIGFDTLFRLLDANPENMIVGAVAAIAGLFLYPFRDMFVDQAYLLTALIAVLGYSLLAGIVLAVLNSARSSLARRRAVRREREQERAAASERARWQAYDSEAGRGTQRPRGDENPTIRIGEDGGRR